MPPVAVRILHPAARPAAGPLSRWVAAARSEVADDHRRAFLEAGADDAEIVTGALRRAFIRRPVPPLIPGGSGERPRRPGLGAVPLATAADRRAFVETAARDGRVALANNRYSADVVAISRVDALPIIPDLPATTLCRAGSRKSPATRSIDLRGRWRLAFDIDGPLDLVLARRTASESAEVATVVSRLAAVSAVAADRRAELLIAGRTSAATLGVARAPRGGTRPRVGRGAAVAGGLAPGRGATNGAHPSWPASVLVRCSNATVPARSGAHLARFGDAAIVELHGSSSPIGSDRTRRAGRWPEDRFASDLLLPNGSPIPGQGADRVRGRCIPSRSCSVDTRS